MSNAPQTPPSDPASTGHVSNDGASTGPASTGPVSTGGADVEPRPEREVERAVDQLRVRRAPKYPVFIFGGIILGVIVTFIAASVAPGRNDDRTPFVQAFGYFALYGIAIGAVVGSVVAIVIDAVSSRRARSVDTERVTYDPEVEDAATTEAEGVPAVDAADEPADEPCRIER